MSGIYENPMDRQDDPRDADDFLRGEAAQGELHAHLLDMLGVKTHEEAGAEIGRLHGLAVQGEQQAVACIDHRHLQLLRQNWTQGNTLKHPEDAGEGDVLLYTRPQPVAVAGDAVCMRAAKALLAARSHIGAERPDDDEDDAAWWDELTTLADALALSAAPAAPEAGKVVVREAALRLAIRELNHARKGIESAGRANYVHRLLLAMLGEEPIHEAAEPAAPAPVAGDAVAKLPERWHGTNGADLPAGHSGISGEANNGRYWLSRCAGELEAALAQDRASQAGAAGVPDGWRDFSSAVNLSLAAMATVPTPDNLFDLDAIPRDPVMDQVRNIREAMTTFSKPFAVFAAAPPPDAEGEVR